MASSSAILIWILLLHAIVVHVYVLPRLSDAAARMHRNDGAKEGGPVLLPASEPSSRRRSDDEYDAATASNATTTTTTTTTSTSKRILVVYSGPNDAKSHRAELYERNMDYFLSHGGIVCDAGTDTVVVVGHEYHASVLPRIRKLNDMCRRRGRGVGGGGGGGGDAVTLVARRNVCYDMESARLALYGGVGSSDLPPIPTYDYFVFVNCGVTGPGERNPPPPSSLSSTSSSSAL